MSSPADELSEYERARLANIAENRKILVSLGLEDEWRLTSKRSTTQPEAPNQKRSKEPPPLTEEQKAALARCADWLPRFEVWLRGEVSVDNANKTMDRVKELVSGKGVYLRGFGVAFSGTAVSIFDDLVSLRAFAHAKFGPKGNNRDAGGWHLSHLFVHLDVARRRRRAHSGCARSDGGHRQRCHLCVHRRGTHLVQWRHVRRRRLGGRWASW